MDYIFIIGPSAVGKTTLAKALHEHFQGVYIKRHRPLLDYPYALDDERRYVSWVQSRNLR